MNAIKELRKAANMSQNKFATYLGIPVANIQHWEQGVSNPPSYIPMLIYRVMKADGYIKEGRSLSAADSVRHTQATLSIEGMTISDAGLADLKKMAAGEMTREGYQNAIKQRYQENGSY